jgi:5-methylcytosine-specific restriction endonuclease McrA
MSILYTKKLKGKNNPNWKEGITSVNKRIRSLKKYKNWRKAIFLRDNWTCQKCNKRGGNLEAHHIKSFAKYPKLRFVLSNGETRCDKCHPRYIF